MNNLNAWYAQFYIKYQNKLLFPFFLFNYYTLFLGRDFEKYKNRLVQTDGKKTADGIFVSSLETFSFLNNTLPNVVKYCSKLKNRRG